MLLLQSNHKYIISICIISVVKIINVGPRIDRPGLEW